MTSPGRVNLQSAILRLYRAGFIRVKIVKFILIFLLSAVSLIVLGYFCLISYIKGHELTPEESARLVNELKKQPDDNWALSKSNASARAVELMKDDFYWTCIDDNSPFGNDNGSDALTHYRRWRKANPFGNTTSFLESLCESFQAPLSQWEMIYPNSINTFLDMHKLYVLETADDVLISVAFAQLVLDGKIEPSVRKLAIDAIGKESDANVIKKRGWVDPRARSERLAKMLVVLKAVE